MMAEWQRQQALRRARRRWGKRGLAAAIARSRSALAATSFVAAARQRIASSKHEAPRATCSDVMKAQPLGAAPSSRGSRARSGAAPPLRARSGAHERRAFPPRVALDCWWRGGATSVVAW